MIFSFNILKIIQLGLLCVWCLRFRPTVRWCLGAALIPTLGFLIPGSYESGDFTAHIIRTMDLTSSLQHGIFPVRWAWLLHGGYGYPLFSFFASLPYYILSAIHTLGFSYVHGMKIYLAVVYIGAVGSMWYCAEAVFAHEKQKKLIATVTAALYAFTPYMLINLEFRAAMGELTGFALFPLLIYAVFRDRRILFCVVLSALILSHPGVTLLGVPWVFLLLVLLKKVQSFAFPTLLAGGLVNSYLIPSLVEAKYTEQVSTAQAVWWTAQTFQPMTWLFWSPWRLGFLLQGHQGEVAYGPGTPQWGVFAVSLYLLVKRKLSHQNSRIFLALSILTFIGLFMMLPSSAGIWNTLPLIRKLQFPTRIMLYPTFSLALIGGYVFVAMGLRKLLFCITLFLSLGWTALNWSHRAYKVDVDDAYLQSHIPQESSEFERLPEAVPIWKQDLNAPRTKAFILEENDAISNQLLVEPTKRTYSLQVLHDTLFQENTLYFPGWKALVNGQEREIVITKNGTMLVALHPEDTTLEFTFTNTPVRWWSNTISIISLAIFAVWMYLQPKTLGRKERMRKAT